jgi:hypothetical protein
MSRVGLFENYLLRHPISEEFACSLAHELTLLAESISDGSQQSGNFSLADNTLINEEIKQGISDGVADER